MKLISLTLRTRLWAGFGLMVALVGVAAGVGWFNAGVASDKTGQMIDQHLAALSAANTCESATLAAREAEQTFLRKPTDELIARVQANMKRVTEGAGVIRQVSTDEERTKQADSAQALAGQYGKLFGEVAELNRRRGFNQDLGLQGDLRKAVHEVEKTVTSQNLPDLSVLMLMCRRHEKDYLLRADEKYLKDIEKRVSEFKEKMIQLKLPEDSQNLMSGLWVKYVAAMKTIVDLDKEIAGKVEEFGKVAEKLQQEAGAIAAAARTELDTTSAQVRQGLTQSGQVMLGVLLAGAFIAFIVAWLTSRSVTRPIHGLIANITEIQKTSDLTRRATIKSRDEIGMLGECFNGMVGTLHDLITEVKTGAEQIDGGAQQIAASSQTLAQGATEQAASLEQISASIEEISSQTKLSAENAELANKLAEESKKSADQGQREMTQMSQAVSEIKQSSDEISKIIKVIDDIAFQTNLLALNAAVEAARAGDAGKGFAVVAEEVRSLAQRSATAAKNTAAMIEESVKRSENGVQIAQRVGQALEQITTGANKVNALLSDIASASKEQASGIAQVNQGVGQLDQVTQQNSGNSEELASSAEEMSAQIAALNTLVAQFKVNSGPLSNSTPPASPTSHGSHLAHAA